MIDRILILANSIYLPEEVGDPCGLVLEDGRIHSVVRSTHGVLAETIVDLRPWRIAPGYVDLHTHGFASRDVTSGTESDIAAMAEALPCTGVTSFLPTVASTGRVETLEQVRRISAVMRERRAHGAEVLGIRLEGPFISRARKGAQDEAAIRPPDARELASLVENGPIRIVDFAPEEDRQLEFLRALLRYEIVPSIGHTAASYEQTIAALDAGARHCTHLFNAMPPLEQRAPGPVGALLTDPRATVEIIADGVHLHAAALRLIYAARGARSTALVTDAMPAAGLPDGDYPFLARRVKVADGAARLPDGTLAGSILTLDAAVRNAVDLAGVSWSDAIRMATLTPARIAGQAQRKGALRPGADADFVALDERGVVHQTWRGGQKVFESPGHGGMHA
jgi:N-acetylglucosamine-6-phosphate deacetylase